MKKKFGKKQSVIKGMSSAVVLSIIIHAALFLLAGMLVVFTVVKKKEVEFEPPKAVERPKMKLKKPKVKIKKSSKPKPTKRIVTKMNRASMPNIQLPEMSGMGGDGLGDVLGGFDIMPNLDDASLFGGTQSVGSDLVGTFYDFKRNKDGTGIIMSDFQFVDELMKFARDDWDTRKLDRKFYTAPKKLYATTFMMPSVRSAIAPWAFGEQDTIGFAWMVLYKGPLVHKEGIKFRFWGHGDDVLIVRVGGEVVLNAAWPDGGRGTENIVKWRSSSAKSRQYFLGNTGPGAVVGDWITLEPGVAKTMEVMIAEVPGGNFNCYLMVEVEGVEYERSRGQSMPILPVFKTQELSLELIDAISEHMIEEEAALTGGPVFCDYTTESNLDEVPESEAVKEQVEEAITDQESIEESPMRSWTISDGKTLEAEFIGLIGGKAVLRNAKGKQLKLPFEQLSVEDQEFVELTNPPRLKIDFVKLSSQRTVKVTPYLPEIPPRVLDYEFGAKVKQTSPGTYNHELVLEYFALGQQHLDGQKYKLLDRRKTTFTLSAENDLSFRFTGDPVEVISYELAGSDRGVRYAEYLVVITDKRGKIIQHSSSGKWLFKNLKDLRELPVGAFLNKKGERVRPTGPPSTYY